LTNAITIYETDHAAKGGFFSYVFQALIQCTGAVLSDAPRPLPQLTQPREHVSAWIEVDVKQVLLDMSDHVFLLDLPALRACDVYLKTNFHPATAKAVLAESGEEALLGKIKPFFSFAGYLHEYLRPDPVRNFYERFKGHSEQVCHVIGVYENLRRDGERSVYQSDAPEMTPNRAHFWARVHTREALMAAGLTGTYRLTSRCNPAIEDQKLIQPNLSQRAYRRAFLRAQMPVINTLPHALLPWKATEALALGRPFIVDVPPLTAFPASFALKEGDHYLSLLPAAEFSSEKEGRVLHAYSLGDFQAGAQKIDEVFRDSERMAHMRSEVRKFREQALKPETLVKYILECVGGEA
jgi:hypothetical protein